MSTFSGLITMKPFRLSLLSLVCVILSASYASAQYQNDDADSAPSNGGNSSVARLQVKITELEDQIRKLSGAIEQATYENRQLKAQMDKVNTDVSYRLDALEKKQQSAPVASVPAENPVPDSGKLRPVETPKNTEEAPNYSIPKFSSSREHYNYAFKLLNQAKYQESGAAFLAFTKNYPKDPLIGNAWYWLGETYYVNHDYVRAADDFRQGYESMPTGPKAPDNLLKLAISMNALKKDKEACVILKQVVAKFGNAGSTKQRAEQEMITIGCNNP
jgi:tol-pal system protein YbgF